MRREWYPEGARRRFDPPAVGDLVAIDYMVHQIRVSCDLDDDTAERVADWAADWGQRLGACTARPVFDMDGGGPQCSWCGAIWPLCGHHHLSTTPTDDDERTTR